MLFFPFIAVTITIILNVGAYRLRADVLFYFVFVLGIIPHKHLHESHDPVVDLSKSKPYTQG